MEVRRKRAAEEAAPVHYIQMRSCNVNSGSEGQRGLGREALEGLPTPTSMGEEKEEDEEERIPESRRYGDLEGKRGVKPEKPDIGSKRSSSPTASYGSTPRQSRPHSQDGVSVARRSPSMPSTPRLAPALPAGQNIRDPRSHSTSRSSVRPQQGGGAGYNATWRQYTNGRPRK